MHRSPILSKFVDSFDITKSIEWLRNNGSVVIRYLTEKHLLGTESSSSKIRELWSEVENCNETKNIFSKQAKNGSWCTGGPWAGKPSYSPKNGYTPYSPKYATTIWVLTILGDMGFDISNKQILKACEYTMTYQCTKGTFGSFAKSYYKEKTAVNESSNIPCHLGGYLMGLGKVGMGPDPRLDKSYNLLVRWQRDDGGWLNQRHITGQAAPYKVWSRSCPWVTYFCCQALMSSDRQECKEPLRKGLHFLASHLAIKAPKDIKRFYYHGHEMVKELILFSEMGTDVPSKVLRVLLSWLIEMYDKEVGNFHYTGKPISKMSRKEDGHTPREFKYRLYHLIEDDWLTYYMVRLASNLYLNSSACV